MVRDPVSDRETSKMGLGEIVKEIVDIKVADIQCRIPGCSGPEGVSDGADYSKWIEIANARLTGLYNDLSKREYEFRRGPSRFE